MNNSIGINAINKNSINPSSFELSNNTYIEKHFIAKFNSTQKEYCKDKTINELFEEQVDKNPDKIALVFGQESLTYQELNKRSNQVARVLRDNEIRADDIVGILVKRSFNMIIGIIGILKAGGAYLPALSQI